MDNKEEYFVSTEPLGGQVKEASGQLNNRKGSVINEAADVYGDVEKAEHYGYVERGLKSRHVQFIGRTRNKSIPSNMVTNILH